MTTPAWLADRDATTRPLVDVLLALADEEGRGSRSGTEVTADESRRAAYTEGIQRAKATIAELIERFHNAILELELVRDRIIVDTEQQLVELALHITREVLTADCATRRAFTERMAEHGLRMLREADEITLRVGSADYTTLRKKHPELIREKAVVRIVEDPAVKLGGVIAEANIGRVDATLERRLHDIATRLRSEFAALDAAQEAP